MTWYWPPDRHVRAEGKVVPMDDKGTDELWRDRPREAQLQVLAFEQSSEVASRAELEDTLTRTRQKVATQEVLDRPHDWGGFTLVPDCVQFWGRADDGLPDRLLYRPRHHGLDRSPPRAVTVKIRVERIRGQQQALEARVQ